jgi:hypothetical protein
MRDVLVHVGVALASLTVLAIVIVDSDWFRPAGAESSDTAAGVWEGDLLAEGEEVYRTHGIDSQRTEVFVIPPQSRRWTLHWATTPYKTSGHFGVTIRRENGELVTWVVYARGYDVDHMVISGSGAYYLDILTTQPYAVTVSALN